MREETIKVLKGFAGYILVVVFAVLGLIERLVRLIKIGFFMIDIFLTKLITKLNTTAGKLLDDNSEEPDEEIEVEIS